MNIAPGTAISIELTKRPTSEAARKTLTRLFRKDPAVAKAVRTRKAKRPSREEWVRGGMMWHHQMKSHAPIALEPGASYQLRATVDVLRDLASVQKFVKVSKR